MASYRIVDVGSFARPIPARPSLLLIFLETNLKKVKRGRIGDVEQSKRGSRAIYQPIKIGTELGEGRRCTISDL